MRPARIPRLARWFLALAIAAAVLGAAAALLPATLLSHIAQRSEHSGNVELRDAAGTVWNGEATLLANDHDLGTLRWSLHPTLLLGGELGGDWRLRHARHDVAGFASCDMDACRATLAGTVSTDALEVLLAGYPVAVSGPPFEIETLAVRLHRTGFGADGRILWSGGTARYGGSTFGVAQALPAMAAQLRSTDSGVAATVTAQDRHLIEAHLGCNGVVDAGLTAGFARLFLPFPRSMRDDAIVLRTSMPLWTQSLCPQQQPADAPR